MMQYTKFRMASFSMQIEVAIRLFIKVHAPFYQFRNLSRCISHHLFHSLTVTNIVTGNHCVFYVFLEIINFHVCYRGNSTLCKSSIGFVKRIFANNTYITFLGSCNFQSIAHACHSCTNNQKVILKNHKIKPLYIIFKKLRNCL